MKKQEIDSFSEVLAADVRESVHSGSASGVTKRREVLVADFPDANAIRRLAGQIKQHTIEHLDKYLEQAERSLTANGVKVHFAWDGASAKEAIVKILEARKAHTICKSKSMASEEIELNDYLTDKGYDIVETDLGEFILQLDNDHPSHVVKPIIHKNRRQIATTFEKHGLGAYNDEPEVITQRARKFLRKKYLQGEVTMTGGNFISAESGRMVIVTNEGNSRFGLAGAKCHIALIGIEKLVPTDRDLGVMLNLLGRSATGQQLTVYTEFVSGPRSAEQPEGPEEMHVILFNNNRTEVLASDCREILRCIRCGACMNVCPVYRQSSGHAYRSVYPGPLGAVLSPLLAGKARFPELADLPKASSLCGACQEVCPVDIPIPDLLLRLRNRAKLEKAGKAAIGTPDMTLWATLATHPTAWRTAMKSANLLNGLPYDVLPLAPLRAWSKQRTLPRWEGGKFRAWMKDRKQGDKS
ncbi:MAG: LutB/LldF family L-lactate oxidation iron-sulfur protein [Verrucomicrobiota bacterium JB022]|nr:LutB/LldF family L-lactate oxidation iron-sulfur protein [Verrucomicrobiota bacterium JB022]